MPSNLGLAPKTRGFLALNNITMRSSVLLTQLALFASTSHAFYPFAPDWLEEEWVAQDSLAATGIKLDIKQRASQPSTLSPEAVARHAARLAAKYGTPIDRRDNAYQIMKASDPEGDYSAALHQDGGDYSYFIEIELGSKREKFLMLVDTGSGSTWVMGSNCKSQACGMHDLFGPEDSDTIEELDETFSITYGTGVVNGTKARDSIRFAGLDVKYKFGVAGWASNDFVKFPFDGVLGLAGGKASSDLLLDVFGEKLDKNIFAVALNRAADGPNNGELSLGAIDPERHNGEISYTPLALDNDWVITLEDISFDGKKAGVGGVRSYIDTGTSFIFASPERVKKFHSLIPGAESADGSTWRVPCNSKGKLEFSFAGGSYEVSPKDWISPQNSNGKCTSNIYGLEIVPGAWLLGDAFIKNVYTVFDWDEKRIGFAPLAAPSAPAPSSTSSQASSPTQPPSTDAPSGGEQATSITTTLGSTPTNPSEPGSESSPGLVGGPGGPQTPVPEAPGNPEDDGLDETTPGGSAPGLVSRDAAAFSTILCIGTIFALLF